MSSNAAQRRANNTGQRCTQWNFPRCHVDYVGVNRLRNFAAVLIAAALLIVMSATPAAAHTLLVSADPEDGATTDAAPKDVTFEFSENVDEASTQLSLTDSAGKTINTKKAQFDKTTVTVPIWVPKAGKYTVSYRLVSVDGHPVDGSVSFTTKSASPQSASPAPSAADSHSSQAQHGQDNLGWGTVIGVIGGAALLIIVVVLAIRFRSRAKR